MSADAAESLGPSWTRRGATCIGLLLAGYLVVLTTTALLSSGGSIGITAPPMIIASEQLEPLRGRVRQVPGVAVFEQPDQTGVAIVGARTPSFAASDYQRVTVNLRLASAPQAAVMFVWRSRETPGRTFSKRLELQPSGLATADLDGEPGWGGSIVGVALALQGPLPQPVGVESMTLSSVSFGSVLHQIASDWATFFRFRGNSFTFPFDEERTQTLSLLVATALAGLVAAVVYVQVMRRRKRTVDARVLWGLFLVAWLLLDLRWQVNLGRQLLLTAQQFAGKSIDDKHRAEEDHQIYEVMQQVRAALPPAPVRLLLLSDIPTLRTRGAYFLLPHNVLWQFGRRNPRPAPEQLHPGEYVLLMLYSGLVYDRGQQRLVWPDGRSRNVQETYAPPGGPVLLHIL